MTSKFVEQLYSLLKGAAEGRPGGEETCNIYSRLAAAAAPPGIMVLICLAIILARLLLVQRSHIGITMKHL